MSRNEAQTRRDLIDPVLLTLGWTNDLIKVEVTPGGTDIIDGKAITSVTSMNKAVKGICDILRRDKAKGARLYVPYFTGF